MPTIYLAWGITGAGHFLAETVKAVASLQERYDLAVTCLVSAAGAEVLRMYGLWRAVEAIAPGGYYRELVTQDQAGASNSIAGRLAQERYSALLVAPATANTVAKIVAGIADTLVTCAVAMAQKAGLPVLILPTDAEPGPTQTMLPTRVDRQLCRACPQCPPLEACPTGAITLLEGKAHIDLLKCEGCSACVSACPHGAILAHQRVTITPRPLDLENIRRLSRMPGFTILTHPSQIQPALLQLLNLTPHTTKKVDTRP